MAKKEVTIANAVDDFKSINAKVGFTEFIRYNKMLYASNVNRKHVVLLPDEQLWLALMDDKDFVTREMNLLDKKDLMVQKTFRACEDITDDGWIQLDDDKIKNNEMIDMELPGYPYPLQLNSKLFIYRFKKDDFNNFYYKLIIDKRLFMIKKYFDSAVEGGGFTMIRIFHII